MYREGQSRGRPKRAEHGRTVVRIATPASVLQPRPRSTVHDFRALPVLFFPRSSQRNKKRRVGRTISVFQEKTRATCAASESDRIDSIRERKLTRKINGRFSGGSVFPPLFVAGKMAAVTIPSFPRNSAFESLVQWARTNEQRIRAARKDNENRWTGSSYLFIMRHIDLAAWTVVQEVVVVVSMASR